MPLTQEASVYCKCGLPAKAGLLFCERHNKVKTLKRNTVDKLVEHDLFDTIAQHNETAQNIINEKAATPKQPQPKTMRERVHEFVRLNQRASTIDLEHFKDELKRTEGILPGILRIEREARQLAEDGLFRRLTEEEKKQLNYNLKFAVFEFVR